MVNRQRFEEINS